MKAWWKSLGSRLRLLNRQRLRRRTERRGRDYAQWVDAHDRLTPPVLEALRSRLRALEPAPPITVLIAVPAACSPRLEQAIESVRAQIDPNWELCLALDAGADAAMLASLERLQSADARIRIVRGVPAGGPTAACNDALAQLRTPFVALLDPDDLLREHALLLLAETLVRWPQARVLYSDEDRLDAQGRRVEPWFKPDWNPELLLAQSYVCHLAAFETKRLREVGGFRAEFEAVRDHDLALRCTQGLVPEEIVHIPHVLVHRREAAGESAGQAQRQAGERCVSEQLQRRGIDAQVRADDRSWYTIEARPPRPEPGVTLIVPTRDGTTTLRRCFDSLVRLTRYDHWSLQIIDNGSVDQAFLADLQDMARVRRVQVVRDDRPFNYSSLNNAAVARASTEFVLLLNDDTEVLAPDWLSQLVAWGCQPGVGSVGARLWYPDRSLQHAGVVTGIGGVAGHVHRHLRQGEPGQHGRAMLLQDFSALTAACLLVRRELYLEIGGLDEEQFSVAFNDVDFCLRLRQRGLRNVWVPGAELIHHESVSRGSDRERRNRERAAREIDAMVARWGPALRNDPAYNPNLTLDADDFGLAFPPRVDLMRPWFEGGAADNR